MSKLLTFLKASLRDFIFMNFDKYFMCLDAIITIEKYNLRENIKKILSYS